MPYTLYSMYTYCASLSCTQLLSTHIHIYIYIYIYIHTYVV